MTPSNPDNQQPLIYRIADAIGVFHLVAPVNHTHSASEVEGLADALAAKANAVPAGSPTGGIVVANTAGEISRSNKTIADLLNAIAAKQDVLIFDTTPTTGSTNPVTSGGVKAALDSKQDELTFDNTPTANSTNPVTSGGVKTAFDGKANTIHTHTFIIEETANESASVGVSDGTVNIEVRNEGGGGECEITPSNIGNLNRALSDPDSTPTLNSNNLVTSGGVKAALDGKAPAGDTDVVFEEGENLFVYLPNYFTNGEHQRSFILNYQGEPTELVELFGGDADDTIRILSHDDSTIMVGECYIAVRVIKQPGEVTQGDAYYIIFDGKNDY